MNELPEQPIKELVNLYNRITKSNARYMAYLRDSYDWFVMGFTHEDMEDVLLFLIRENKNNSFKYDLSLGKLLRDTARFQDLLTSATRVKRTKRTPKEQSLYELRKADEPQPIKPPVKVSAEFLADSIRNLKQLQ